MLHLIQLFRVQKQFVVLSVAMEKLFSSRLKAVADLRQIQTVHGINTNSNAWSDVGHPVNEIYDTHYMMGWVDVVVGVGGEGGILEDETIQQYVIKYHLVL
ncbi:hypothetical protein Tco_1279284 [Tanacetum coccineum]